MADRHHLAWRPWLLVAAEAGMRKSLTTVTPPALKHVFSKPGHLDAKQVVPRRTVIKSKRRMRHDGGGQQCKARRGCAGGAILRTTIPLHTQRRSREPHVLFHHQPCHGSGTPDTTLDPRPSLRTRHGARRWKLRIVPSLIPETTRPSQAVCSPSKSTRRRRQGSRGRAVHDAGTARTAGTAGT
ncbi:hypothetical protein COCMIDRAFT_27365 [Bipolaris oryzae ATCC 44560]|uniref:Uncharacterized protein n=1 Tax=Bipolaris oryzae ATCC 44560 TaxID=930090 RepID=W6Z300_COCMI|nr:uncharacterized protein COCMIDRAFT_27365 [Bipolaris oryzae ATCC 44560]EUC44305.1 hypothetical protein COCMIDRAFT_27365 [Bipolaris oryzae ATCC 44560]